MQKIELEHSSKNEELLDRYRAQEQSALMSIKPEDLRLGNIIVTLPYKINEKKFAYRVVIINNKELMYGFLKGSCSTKAYAERSSTRIMGIVHTLFIDDKEGLYKL
jgi:hypothetical protein